MKLVQVITSTMKLCCLLCFFLSRRRITGDGWMFSFRSEEELKERKNMLRKRQNVHHLRKHEKMGCESVWKLLSIRLHTAALLHTDFYVYFPLKNAKIIQHFYIIYKNMTLNNLIIRINWSSKNNYIQCTRPYNTVPALKLIFKVS